MARFITAAAAFVASASAEMTPVEQFRQDTIVSIKQNFKGNFSNLGIVGGDVVNPMDKYPWMAGMRSSETGGSFCGGTLIARDWVLTAAHCAPIAWTSVDFFYRTGNQAGSTKRVRQSFTHPSYNSRNLDYDFLLLNIDSEDRVVPAKLAARSGSDEPVGRMATVIGWGATRENGPSSNEQRQVDVAIVEQSTCNSALSSYGGVTAAMLCAGGIAGQDACQGDSGGPLVVNGDTLVGDVSWGIGCARAGLPGVYGRISIARDWIDGIIGTGVVKWVEVDGI